MSRKFSQIWLAKILIGLVMLINLQCALAFFFYPNRYAPFYELSGLPGETAIRGFGILFMMWNVPYAVALYNPTKNRLSLYEAFVMQIIGVVGETIIYTGIPDNHASLRNAVLRFIIFDGSGVLTLLLAVILVKKSDHNNMASALKI
jgi:hypothetical protein